MNCHLFVWLTVMLLLYTSEKLTFPYSKQTFFVKVYTSYEKYAEKDQ